MHTWVLLEQEYTFEIKYVPGIKNTIPDPITCIDGEESKEIRNKFLEVNVMWENVGTFFLERIRENQRKLTYIQRKKKKSSIS